MIPSDLSLFTRFRPLPPHSSGFKSTIRLVVFRADLTRLILLKHDPASQEASSGAHCSEEKLLRALSICTARGTSQFSYGPAFAISHAREKVLWVRA
jgi:hypothetical protein